jgi:hypothetical protein
VVVVYSNEGLYIGSATDGDTSAHTVFDDDKALLSDCDWRISSSLTMSLTCRRPADRILEGRAALGVRVHLKDEVGD